MPTGHRLAQMQSLDVQFGGAESNVLAALACLNRRCGWTGALPASEIGQFAVRQLREARVEASPVLVPNGRLGTYYVEFAAAPRATQVIYDRAHSAITTLEPGQIDFDYLLDTRLLHLTGITPALSQNCLAIVQALITRANSAEIPISFDVNFRSKLWATHQASATLLPLLQEVDLLLCGQRDAEALFGCKGSPEQCIEQLASMTKAKQLVMTLSDAGVMGWDGDVYHHEPAWPVQIVDRIGAGDALAAGVLHGWLDNDIAAGLRFGTLLAALALSTHGDKLVSSLSEVETLLQSYDSKAKHTLISR